MKRTGILAALVVITLIFAGAASAAIVEYDFITEGKLVTKPGRYTFGDGLWGLENAIYANQNEVTLTFNLTTEAAFDSAMLTMDFTGYDQDKGETTYLSINGHDLTELVDGATAQTWTFDSSWLNYGDEANELTFYIGHTTGFFSTYQESIEVINLILSYEAVANTGNSDTVPIPSAALLLGCGLAGLAGSCRRVRRG